MHRAPHLSRYTLALLLCAAFGLASCGESAVNSNTRLNTRDDTNPDGTPDVSGRYFMAINGPAQLEAGLGAAMPLRVFLYDKLTNAPVAEQTIDFVIEAGETEAGLSSLRASTGLDGEAKVDLFAGNTLGAISVVARHPSANEVTFTIDIVARPSGDLEVALLHSAPSVLALSDIQVRVHPQSGPSGRYSCSDFFPLRQQPEPSRLFVAPTISDLAIFPNLEASERYVVSAIGKGPRGQIAAGGCQDDVRLEADSTRRMELPLQLIAINPVGRYDATHNWDFSQAVADSGSVGSTIVRVLNIFQNPGEEIYNTIISGVRAAVGGLAAGALDTFLSATGLDDNFKNMINNVIENNQALRKIRDAGRDLREVIANLEVHSELIIGKLSSSYEVTGTDNWLGVTLYWRWDCEGSTDPDCGAIHLGAQDTAFADLGILSTQWTGRVVAYDQLQIDQHPITLRYGRLIIYILNHVILPRIAGGATSMSEAFSYWLNCPGIGLAILGEPEKCVSVINVCVRADQISNVCSAAVGTVFGFADTLVRNMEFDIGLTVGGAGKLLELDSDGFVDEIERGTFTGFMTNSGHQPGQQNASPVSATWSAIKVPAGGHASLP